MIAPSMEPSYYPGLRIRNLLSGTYSTKIVVPYLVKQPTGNVRQSNCRISDHRRLLLRRSCLSNSEAFSPIVSTIVGALRVGLHDESTIERRLSQRRVKVQDYGYLNRLITGS